MKNTYEYRYFLFVNYLANKMMNVQFQNFAKLILDEDNGRFMNSQMTKYFYQIDETISELIQNNPMWVFDELEIEQLAEIEPSKLELDYEEFCLNQPFIHFKIP